MRILVGHNIYIPEVFDARPLPYRADKNDQIVAFGHYYPHSPLQKGMTWRELLARCPQGFTPDLYIHWSPEYNPLPAGLEDADCLTVGVFGDWNLGGRALHGIGGWFDLLVADAPGTKVLHRAGIQNVETGLLWAFDPAQHRRLPQAQRDIDILMIGNFNHAVQQERSRWLARVARLSQKYNVMLTSGVYGEEYTRLMNRAKIVFNRSIRGEMNMRAYEAPACGATLFYERENAEIGQIFQDRVECVLYGEDDLEALFDHYLVPQNAEERERIAQAGWERVQNHTYAHHFGDLLNRLETHLPKRGSRTVAAPLSFQNRVGRAEQWIQYAVPRLLPQIEAELDSLAGVAQPPQETAVCAALRATAHNALANSTPNEAERAHQLEKMGEMLLQSLQNEPNNAYLRANYGALSALLGHKSTAKEALNTAFEALQEAPQAWDDPFLPRSFDYFLVAQERLWGQHTPGTEPWILASEALWKARIQSLLAESAFAEECFEEALKHAETALLSAPHAPQALTIRARSLRACGRVEEALTAYHLLLDFAPFEMEAWADCTHLLLAVGRFEDALSLLEAWNALLKACPNYADAQSEASRLRQLAFALKHQKPAGAPPKRLLAFPDWSDSTSWQETLRAFTSRYRPHEPVLLMLRLDPKQGLDAASLLQNMGQFLVHEIGFAPNALPNVTLLNESLAAEDLWKLLYAADICLAPKPLEGFARTIADNLNKPIWTLERLQERQAA